MAQGNGKLPPSQVDSAMPGAGLPLEEEDTEVEVEEEEVEPTEIVEEEDGSVVLNFEDAIKEELLSEPDANLAEALDEEVLEEISMELVAQYKEDRESRQDWENSYSEGLELLGLKYQEREEPFPSHDPRASISGVFAPTISARTGPDAGNNSLYACA